MKKAFEAGEYSKEDEINGDGAMDFKEWFLEFKKGQWKKNKALWEDKYKEAS